MVFDLHFRYVEQLPVALLLTSATVVIHGIGMSGVRSYFRRSWVSATDHARSGKTMTMVGLVAIMMVTHFAEAALWGAFYVLGGLVPDAASAIQYSLASYTTLGGSGIVLPGQWQGFGGFEAMAAMLMFGWSTAMLAAIILKVQGPDEPAGPEPVAKAIAQACAAAGTLDNCGVFDCAAGQVAESTRHIVERRTS